MLTEIVGDLLIGDLDLALHLPPHQLEAQDLPPEGVLVFGKAHPLLLQRLLQPGAGELVLFQDILNGRFQFLIADLQTKFADALLHQGVFD